MRGTRYVFAAALILASAPLFAQKQEHPPVAEAARQAREAQKRAPGRAKLYTNENIPRGSGGISVVPAATVDTASIKPPAKEGKSSTQTKKPAADEDQGPAYWKKRFAAARAKLAKAESELAALERGMGELRLQYYRDPNEAIKQQYSQSDIHEQAAKITAKQAEIDKLRRELTQLEDELRRAGGDPGWAR